jgi:hypothetical protein
VAVEVAVSVAVAIDVPVGVAVGVGPTKTDALAGPDVALPVMIVTLLV